MIFVWNFIFILGSFCVCVWNNLIRLANKKKKEVNLHMQQVFFGFKNFSCDCYVQVLGKGPQESPPYNVCFVSSFPQMWRISLGQSWGALSDLLLEKNLSESWLTGSNMSLLRRTECLLSDQQSHRLPRLQPRSCEGLILFDLGSA